MDRFARVSRVGFALGIVWLGVIGVAVRDFSAVWGPLPKDMPGQTALALIYGLVAIVAGVALLFRRTAAAAAVTIFAYVGLWWLVYMVPPVIRAPLTEMTWLDAGMHGMLLAGAWTLYAELAGHGFLGDAKGMTTARVFFGLCLIPTGLSHFFYTNLTAPLIPAWIPFHLALAYVTGACHLAAGLGILFGVVPRLAAQMESLMLGLFTVIVWIPRVIAAPTKPGNWTEIWISAALTAAAAVVAAASPPSSLAKSSRAVHS